MPCGHFLEAEMVKPISPSEVIDKKKETIPNEVIEAFNELIAENFDGHSSHVEQNEVISLIVNKLSIAREYIFKKHWLDVEDIFREAGWEVEYDKPGYNESYSAYFIFTKPRKR